MQAYKDLASRIGTDQIIWCDTQPGQHVDVPSSTRQEWILEVPCDEILEFVDVVAWEQILGTRGLPLSVISCWRREARRRFPNDRGAQEKYVENREEELWAQDPPSGSWWNYLFVERQADGLVSALIRHPARPEWVISNPLIE